MENIWMCSIDMAFICTRLTMAQFALTWHKLINCFNMCFHTVFVKSGSHFMEK